MQLIKGHEQELVTLDSLSRAIIDRGWFWEMDTSWGAPPVYEATVHIKHVRGGYSRMQSKSTDPLDALQDAFRQSVSLLGAG